MKRSRATLTVVALLLSLAACEKPKKNIAAVEEAHIPISELQSPTRIVVGIAADGSKVAVRTQLGSPGQEKSAVKLYDTVGKRWIDHELTVGAQDGIEWFNYSPDGRFIASVIEREGDLTLRVVNASDMTECFSMSGDAVRPFPAIFSADDSKLLHSFNVVNPATGALIRRLRLPEGKSFQERDMAFTPDGRFVYVACDTGVLIWDAAVGKILIDWDWNGTGGIAAMGASLDGSVVRALMEEGSIATFDPTRPKSIKVTRLDVPTADRNEPHQVPLMKDWTFNEAAFTPDASRVLRFSGQQIDVFDVANGELLQHVTLPAGTHEVFFDFLPMGVIAAYTRANSVDNVVLVRLPK